LLESFRPQCGQATYDGWMGPEQLGHLADAGGAKEVVVSGEEERRIR
jgi:hypothetical protein